MIVTAPRFSSLAIAEQSGNEPAITVQSQLGHDEAVASVIFSPDGKLALSGSWDNTIRLWHVVTGFEIRKFSGHAGWVELVTFSPDGKLALSGSTDKTLKLWDIKSGQEAQELRRAHHA